MTFAIVAFIGAGTENTEVTIADTCLDALARGRAAYRSGRYTGVFVVDRDTERSVWFVGNGIAAQVFAAEEGAR